MRTRPKLSIQHLLPLSKKIRAFFQSKGSSTDLRKDLSHRRFLGSRWLLLLKAMLLLSILSGSMVSAAPQKKLRRKVPLKVLLKTFQDSADSFDPLSLRILLKKIGKNKLNLTQWKTIRTYLVLNPSVGYDFVYKWEKLRPDTPAELSEVESINDKIDRADKLMLDENFEQAFTIYQQMALFLKKEILDGYKENLFLYSMMLHSMGRALYGAERFQEALTVYSWLPKNYPRFRQVMFEKMWAAFRLGRLDIALGAIASQESSYFSSYLEPESFLVKTYIFKKLCRDSDLNELRNSIKNLKKRIEVKDSNFFNEWAASDIELLSLSRLTKLDPADDISVDVTQQERRNEIAAIKNILQTKYDIEMTRVQRDLTNILAYSNIALGSSDFSFIKKEEIDHTKIMERGDEVWAVNDAEDWVDEIGGHLFIGDSLCKKEPLKTQDKSQDKTKDKSK